MFNLLKTFLLALAGFLYGAVLAVIGLVEAGAGHGSYVLISLSSCPFLWVFQDAGAALFGAPILWCVVGIFLGGVKHRGRTTAFLITVLGHYASIAFCYSRGLFGEWSSLNAKELVLFGLGVYAAGQVALWVLFALGLRNPSAAGR